ncbi:hypothetical protein [Clostridium sp. JNZ J1-5]
MNKTKKIIGGTLIAMSIFASNAFAEVPNGSVILGDKSYSLDYVNDPRNEAEISEAFKAANFKIYVRMFSGEYVDNATNNPVDASIIKPRTYKDANGEKVIDSGSISEDLEVISIE